MEPKISTLFKYVFRFLPKTRVKGWANTVARRTVKMVLVPPDERAVAVINQLFQSLQLQDAQQRLQAVMPLVHRSMLFQDKNGVTLDRSVKEFAYQKAIKAVGMYEYPIKVTEVQQGQVTTVGTGATAERGRTDRYFVAKKQGVDGLPAPILVFFPENGGQPSIVNFGSL